jgi:hypothetical protein
MSFRNQFFTPRYVVEFLVDNTLGRTWYEMRSGDTALEKKCRYLAVQPSANEEGQGPKANDQRAKKDPREIKVLDPACGSGHFLLYCFDLLQTIYEEAYSDSELGPKLQQDFPDAKGFKRLIPVLILTHNIHGIDIDLRVTQLAGLALWLRAQRAFQEMGLKAERPEVKRMNLICAEPMPGEEDLLEEFISELNPHPLGELIGHLVRNVFGRMKLAGETGALLRIEDDISAPIDEARKQWQEMLRNKAERDEEPAKKGMLFDYRKEEEQRKLVFDIADITSEKVWHEAEEEALKRLRDFAKRASNGKGLSRRLFADDAEQGFAFIDLCRQKFDVVLMNPPFGDASLPSKPYIDETYGDTKGDVYKAFVECFQDRLVPGGFLGIISSRTGFFLSGSKDWRERIVLRLYRPLVLADFGMGVLDAMVETAAYVLRSLTKEEDLQLTLQLAKDLSQVPTDMKDAFSTKKYEVTRDLKRHQANAELRRLQSAGFIKPVEGHFPRWSPMRDEIAQASAPSNAPYPAVVCLRLIGEEDKGRALLGALDDARDSRVFIVQPEEFSLIPNKPFSYWGGSKLRRLFVDLKGFASDGRDVRVGLQTNNDFRWLRLSWEVSASQIGRSWFFFAKGGEFSPYYSGLHLLVEWADNGRKNKEWKLEELKSGRITANNSKCWNESWYFRRGLTFPRRTNGLSVRVLPEGCIFADKGPAVTLLSDDKQELLSLCAILNSQPFGTLVSMQLGRVSLAQSYESGLIRQTPIVTPVLSDAKQLSEAALLYVRSKQQSDTSNEISQVFYLPAILQAKADTLKDHITAWQARAIEFEEQLAAYQSKIDDIAFSLYGISDESRRTIEASATRQESPNLNGEQTEDDDPEEEGLSTDQRRGTADLISYSVGCAFGRWDVRFGTGERPAPHLPDPFAPLPACAPGALTSEDGLPLSEVPEGYPLRVDTDGILVDDTTHADDIINCVREVLELLWAKEAEAREREVCELLGIKELRDYFRKPAAGGFWTDHIKRYSKSRRKAPIYWLLRSSKGNYAIWLYYHRLNKDMLYKALLNYVEPKLRLEENNLSQLRQRRETVGTTGHEAKQLEKELDKQESFISELRDFHDKLKRVADLHLEPDLNDGVVLNIAPLHELVPWTEAQKYWKELTEGKYEWSSISKQLRERGMITK